MLSLVLLATLEVTTIADSGTGSLRAAMETANTRTCGEPCVIAFRIPGPVPDAGYFTIRPQSLLPFITAPDVMIDGTTQTQFTGDTNPHGPEIEIDGTDAGWGPGIKYVRTQLGLVRGLAINRFEGNGIVVDGSRGAHVFGNYVGIDPTGTFARPNGANGILFVNADLPIIAGNIVGGNRGNGIFFHRSNGTIERNNVGFGRSPAHRIPNGAHGIDVNAFVAVRENHIAYNTLHGILAGPLARGPIVRNRIHRNGLLSIARDGDRGTAQITFARATPNEVIVRGTVHANPNVWVDVDIYAAPHRNEFGLAEAHTVVASVRPVVTDEHGNGTFEARYQNLLANGWVSATVTIESEGTSELGAPFPLESEAIEVTTTRDDGSGSLRWAIETCTQCWIAFHVPENELTNGVAIFEPKSPLPAIKSAHVIVDGSSQSWYTGDRVDGHEVEIRGASAGAGANGLQLESVKVLLRDFAVSGFDGDGIRGDAVDALMSNVDASTNANGMVMSGNDAKIIGGTYRSNRGDGLRLLGGRAILDGIEALANGSDGIYGGSQSFVSIHRGIAANNAGNGIASAPDAIAMFIDARTFANGLLGIDRYDDGPTPAEAPELLSAEYDASRNITFVRGRMPASTPVLDLPSPDQVVDTLQFFADGEYASSPSNHIRIEGDSFFAELPGDLRGKTITATRTVSHCFHEFGCSGVDTSEYSNPKAVALPPHS